MVSQYQYVRQGWRTRAYAYRAVGAITIILQNIYVHLVRGFGSGNECEVNKTYHLER